MIDLKSAHHVFVDGKPLRPYEVCLPRARARARVRVRVRVRVRARARIRARANANANANANPNPNPNPNPNQLCRHFEEGRCPKGDARVFAH